jgi:N-sulfoglucosamine sulfohydrolase
MKRVLVCLAPTVLDYAGIDWTDSGMMAMTGQSWRPILASVKSGRVVPERDHVLIGKERTDVGRPHNWGYPIRGIVTATHLYLRNYEPTVATVSTKRSCAAKRSTPGG